jgi:CheY-like chemotaxis protein
LAMSANATIGTVLYAEDEECDRLFMEAAFAKVGIGGALRTVEDGQVAEDYLAGSGVYGDRERHPMPVLVLLDLNMPQVSGFEVLKWMRQRPELASLPVVVFSSSSRQEDKARALELGAAEFIEKPPTMGKFGEVAERVRSKWLSKCGV